MITENLSTLKIHKLTQEQYDRELAAGSIDETALYLTPDEEIDLSGYATVDDLKVKADTVHAHDDLYYTEDEIEDKLNNKSDIGHTHTEYYTKEQIEAMEFITVADIDTICGANIQVATTSEVKF